MDLVNQYTPLVVVAGLAGELDVSDTSWTLSCPPIEPVRLRDDLVRTFESKAVARQLYVKSLERRAQENAAAGGSHLLTFEFVQGFLLRPKAKPSSLSPRNPTSDLYPDGLLSEAWVRKYAYEVPAMVVAFYTNTQASEPSWADQVSRARDRLAQRDMKLVVVLVGSSAQVTDERLAALRRATGLASRTGLLFLADTCLPVETDTLVGTVCQLAQSQAQVFYSSVAKRLRRRQLGDKKASADHAISGQHELSSSSWDVRYMFKTAALAEFRLDIDSALRLYETTYQAIMETCEASGPENSRRWLQLMALLDAVACKMYKHYLYLDQPNVAFRRFLGHLNSVRALNQSKGLAPTQSASYARWTANQYALFARLVTYADPPALRATAAKAKPFVDDNNQANTVGLPRMGYLHLSAIEFLRLSERLGYNSDDGEYVGIEMHAENSSLTSARSDFVSGQKSMSRTGAFVLYQQAEVEFEQGRLQPALDLYKQVVEIYRQDKWSPILQAVLGKVRQCSLALKQDQDLLSAQFELLSFDDATEISADQSTHTSAVLSYGPLSCTFTFESPKCHLGLACKAQLRIVSAAAISLARIELAFKGFDPVAIEHEDRDGFFFCGRGNLHFNKDQARVYEMTLHPQRLGPAQLETVTGVVDQSVSIIIPLSPRTGACVAWTSGSQTRHYIYPGPAHTIEISPRPARIQLSSDLCKTVFAGETVDHSLVVANNEDQNISMDIQATCEADNGTAEVVWLQAKDASVMHSSQDAQTQHSYAFRLEVSRSASTVTLAFSVSYKVDGVVVRDAMDLAVSVLKPFRVNFGVSPLVRGEWPSVFVFDSDQVDKSEEEKTKTKDTGSGDGSNKTPSVTSTAMEAAFVTPKTTRRWNLTATLLYLGTEPVSIHNSSLNFEDNKEFKCEIVSQTSSRALLSNNNSFQTMHCFDTSRIGPRDSRTVAAEAELVIEWSRQGSEIINKFFVPTLRLNLPQYEPRVVCRALVDPEEPNTLQVQYHIENPTMHMLTYAVSMASCSSFAFQGPKSLNVRLLPFSVKVLEYRMRALTKERPIAIPVLSVYDTHYNRSLVVTAELGELSEVRGELVWQPNKNAKGAT